MNEMIVKTVTIDRDGNLLDEKGTKVVPPSNWEFLPAGDAGVTRKVTAKKQYWKVVFRRGRRVMSKGVWAPSTTIAEAQKAIIEVRTSPDYAKKMETAKRTREKKQELYEKEFRGTILKFLNFHPKYNQVAIEITDYVTQHAIPVGSGTVARTQTIPVEDRARMAVLAWMRHKTTNYDRFQIPKVKGERKAVRRSLAEQSKELLQYYREGKDRPSDCPLFRGVLMERRIREDEKRRKSYFKSKI